MAEPIIDISIPNTSLDTLISQEWLVTNALGGYASGSLAGINTRRHHGIFIPNLPSPRGRTVLLTNLQESVSSQEQTVNLGGFEYSNGGLDTHDIKYLKSFRLEWHVPVWTYDINGTIIEKRIWMPYGRNSVYVSYTLTDGLDTTIKLRPFVSCRQHDSPLNYPKEWPFTVNCQNHRYEIMPFEGAPVSKMSVGTLGGVFVSETQFVNNIFYRVEAKRGLDCVESLFSPGFIQVPLKRGTPVYWIASTEQWNDIDLNGGQVFDNELKRRREVLSMCTGADQHVFTAQLALAADQFIILPRTRNTKNTLVTPHEQARTIIAGYHWFTDWGRDTMISLEGLTLCTGRADEAKAILETFGRYVRKGLLPNHFPEGEREAVYNTVDATFWFFHAIDRYFQYTHDQETIKNLFPTLEDIILQHVKGTDFGIHMDIEDSLIEASAEGFQLTWMDAKVDEWVVTPRRGKPVEIQALWYNALKLMEEWGVLLGKPVDTYRTLSSNVFKSFNASFWYEKGGYLYDVIDTHGGSDTSLRPNQVFAISLRYPVLDPVHWKQVVDIIEAKLWTPYGLRTLSQDDPDYHSHYEGNRWERDAAYHQGLVWTWLFGPFLDAWNKVYQDPAKALEFFKSLQEHLNEAGIGTISEIFDADRPHIARGCIAQAWSVAEVLRCFIRLRSDAHKPIK